MRVISKLVFCGETHKVLRQLFAQGLGMLTRRLFSLGLLAAPVIIRTPGLLMPVKTFLKRQSLLIPLSYSGSFRIGDIVTILGREFEITALNQAPNGAISVQAFA